MQAAGMIAFRKKREIVFALLKMLILFFILLLGLTLQVLNFFGWSGFGFEDVATNIPGFISFQGSRFCCDCYPFFDDCVGRTCFHCFVCARPVSHFRKQFGVGDWCALRASKASASSTKLVFDIFDGRLLREPFRRKRKGCSQTI
jgi:hypothetical protein